jgi:hypothetical protein
MILFLLLLLNPCTSGDTIGVDSAQYAGFNGYQYVYSVNTPAGYTDTWLMDDQEQVIGHVPAPNPMGTYGPADRIVVCYTPDIYERLNVPAPTSTITTTTTTEVPSSLPPTKQPPTAKPRPGLKASPVPAAVNPQIRWTTSSLYQRQIAAFGMPHRTCAQCASTATAHLVPSWGIR